MKKLFILPLLLASFIVTACVEDDSIVKPGESLVEPLNITLSLSQSGERQVDLNKTRPSFSFKIEKSHPFVETTASLSVISAEELGNGYLPLADNLYRISSTELEFAEDEQSQSVNILFTNLEQLEPATNYALGLKLTSSSTRIEVPAGQERLILILNVGEGGTLRNPYRLRTLGRHYPRLQRHEHERPPSLLPAQRNQCYRTCQRRSVGSRHDPVQEFRQ